jgi:rhodanese-related sulfurtransferase
MNKIIIGIIAVLVLIGGYFMFTNSKSDESVISRTSQSEEILASGNGMLELFGENDFDFGEILMAGGDVKYNYTLKNTGDGITKITNIQTSCMCTEAKVFDIQGESVGVFGMGGSHGANPQISLAILPGEEIIVEATYDPMAHGPDATGELVREIFISTDTNEDIKLKFRGNGVSEFSQVEGPSLAFNNKEYDFGITKQSQGFLETKFEAVNNGSETVIVESLPASCQCVSATIDKKEIPVGEKATITVVFDANLHPEPDGRFFKTIEVVSNIKPSPEIKIFANMDYDLGMDKLKLAVHDDSDEGHDKTNSDGHHDATFTSISSKQLSTMLENKDFVMIDVHTPEQEHIPGTDYLISYDETEKIVEKIPSKDAKVVLYCRSGNMTKSASKELVKMGYTNIYELENGLNEWNAEGREVLPKGSIGELKQ